MEIHQFEKALEDYRILIQEAQNYCKLAQSDLKNSASRINYILDKAIKEIDTIKDLIAMDLDKMLTDLAKENNAA